MSFADGGEHRVDVQLEGEAGSESSRFIDTDVDPSSVPIVRPSMQ